MLPTPDQIRTEAYFRWQRRGEGHGFDLADWFGAKDDLTLMLNYESCSAHYLTAPERTYFGRKDNPTCRYCGRKPNVVSFRKEAHAIPHFTGNRSLFSHDECDVCNKHFSETIEDSFAKLILPLRTLLGIAGKTGIPAYRTKDKTARIDIDPADRHVAVVDRGEDPLFVDDRGSKQLTARLQTQPYIPILVYKCLVKMAIAIMPEDEMPNFTHTVKWLLETQPTLGVDCVRSASCYMYDFLLPWPASVALLRRRTVDTPLPYMLFLLVFGRFGFQVHLPLTPKDNCFAGTEAMLPRLGSIVVPGKGESRCGALRLASWQAVKDEWLDVVLDYESHTEFAK